MPINTLNFSEKEIGTYELEEELLKNPTITKLDISNNSIEELSFLYTMTLPNLVELNVSSTDLKDLAPISEIKSLRILRANNLQSIDNLNFVSKLPELKELYLEFSNLSSLDGLQNLSNLQILDVMGNKDVKNLSPLLCLNIRELYLEGTGICSYSQLNVLKNKRFKMLTVNDELATAASLLTKRMNQHFFDVSLQDIIQINAGLDKSEGFPQQEILDFLGRVRIKKKSVNNVEDFLGFDLDELAQASSSPKNNL